MLAGSVNYPGTRKGYQEHEHTFREHSQTLVQIRRSDLFRPESIETEERCTTTPYRHPLLTAAAPYTTAPASPQDGWENPKA